MRLREPGMDSASYSGVCPWIADSHRLISPRADSGSLLSRRSEGSELIIPAKLPDVFWSLL